MALKFVVDKLDDVPSAFRGEYTKGDDGKFRLVLDGEHPDTAKLKEFRNTNNEVKKERDALKLKVAELEKRAPDEDVAALTAKLATSEAARIEAQSKADASVLKSVVTAAFLKAGGRQKAADYILGQAKSVFTVENGELKTTQFSPSRPGQSLTLDEFLIGQMKESDFAFEPSRGSGAGPLSSGGGTVSNIPELRDPTPEQLGRHADEIMAGKLRVVMSS